MVEHDGTGSADAGDDAISLFKSTTGSADAVTEGLNRQAYEDRLLSFNATTYYAKPACLSPIVCARFGWRNAEKDVLACSSCNEALFIYMNQSLSAKSMEKVCNTYRQQLATAHTPDCTFRLSPEQFERLDGESQGGSTSVAKTTVPPLMVSALPLECMQLMEHPLPSSLLQNRVERLANACKKATDDDSSKSGGWRFPELEVPEEILQFRLEGNNDTDDRRVSFSNIVDRLGAKDTATAMLSILGWVPIDDGSATLATEDTTSTVVSLGCPVCLSIMELTLQNNNGSTDVEKDTSNEPPEKRQRKLARNCNPHRAHRYYCPYVCGFPRTMSCNETPLWQVLLTRLYKENEMEAEPKQTVDEGASFDRIRQVLRMAIAPKKVNLDEDSDDSLGIET